MRTMYVCARKAHKPYTYAISRLRAQVVLYVHNKSLYKQNLYILRKVAYRAHKPHNLRTLSLQAILTNRQDFSKKKIIILSFPFLHLPSLSIMRSEQAKSSRSSRGEPKKRSSTIAPISLEDLMDKEILSSSQDGDNRELSVLSDPSNEKSTKIKQIIHMLDHLKNLIEVLRARHSIGKGLIGNAITTGPNKFCFTRTFLEGGGHCAA